MMLRRAAVVCAAIGLCVPATGASAARTAPRGISVSVITAPGATAAVQRVLRARGFRVDRRAGRRLQVVVTRSAQRRSLAALRGVSAVAMPPSAVGDAVTSQGVDRTGAAALADVARGGAGLRIAVLDLGFGGDVARLQQRRELPPPSRLILRSFDPAGGIAGSNAYGNPTNHGELVAQTVFDYAPLARYLFVSYHTPDDFVSAVSWLVDQRVDIVVHSNNFLEGPFDGTSAVARAVDRAAAAGVLWFNSAGNYGEKHWSGPWVDAGGDGELDWPSSPAGELTVTHAAGHALTFHLSWTHRPGAEPTDVDLFLDRRGDDGAWEQVGASVGRQAAGVPPAERFNGVRPTVAGDYRLRARLVSGPPPAALTLFAREDDIAHLGGVARSVPTPADAAGSVSVGALDWRSNSLVRYSSRGPTADGRLKPDLTAPTGTRLATAGGDPRDVGGTSIAAPNAAGAAAVLLAGMREAGLRPTVGEVRSILAADAFDIGDPGPDPTFGAGRIRVDVEPPVLSPAASPPATPVRGGVRVAVEATDAAPLATWSLFVDGLRVRVGRVAREVIGARIETAALADGAHTAAIEVGDSVGNLRRRAWRFVSDNTAPTVLLQGVEVAPAAQPAVAATPGPRRRGIRVTVLPGDALSRTVRIEATLTRVGGRRVASRSIPVPVGLPRTFLLARAPAGVYVMRVTVRDVAGNTATVTRGVRVGG